MSNSETYEFYFCATSLLLCTIMGMLSGLEKGNKKHNAGDSSFEYDFCEHTTLTCFHTICGFLIGVCVSSVVKATYPLIIHLTVLVITLTPITFLYRKFCSG